MLGDQQQIERVLREMLRSLCKVSIAYSEEIRMQGTLCITVDKCGVFVVQLNETIVSKKIDVEGSSRNTELIPNKSIVKTECNEQRVSLMYKDSDEVDIIDNEFHSASNRSDKDENDTTTQPVCNSFHSDLPIQANEATKDNNFNLKECNLNATTLALTMPMSNTALMKSVDNFSSDNLLTPIAEIKTVDWNRLSLLPLECSSVPRNLNDSPLNNNGLLTHVDSLIDNDYQDGGEFNENESEDIICSQKKVGLKYYHFYIQLLILYVI